MVDYIAIPECDAFTVCMHANLQPDTEPVEDQEVEGEEEKGEQETETAALTLQSVEEVEGLHITR